MKLPGTLIEVPSADRDIAATTLDRIFLGGGLVLSQIGNLTGLELYIVQNWVKRGFLAPPVRKQYSRRQFCRIVIINMLRDILPLDTVIHLLSYINGHLDDESDDLIDDSELYSRYVNLHLEIGDREVTEEELERAIDHAIEGYCAPKEGACERLRVVLRTMAYARIAGYWKAKAEGALGKIGKAQ